MEYFIHILTGLTGTFHVWDTPRICQSLCILSTIIWMWVHEISCKKWIIPMALTLRDTCLCSFKSQMLPTSTLGISTASPSALKRDSLICFIRSKDCLEIMEKTKSDPSTPTEAVRESLEYSSWLILNGASLEKELLNDWHHSDIKTITLDILISTTHHSSGIDNIRVEINLSEPYNLVMGIFYRGIVPIKTW